MEESIRTRTISEISVYPDKPTKSFIMKEESSEFKNRARSFDLPVEREVYSENNSPCEDATFRRTEFSSKGRSSSEGSLSIGKPNFVTSKYILSQQDPASIKFSPKEFELPTDLSELQEAESNSTACEFSEYVKNLTVSLSPLESDKNDSDKRGRTGSHPGHPRRFLSCIDIGPVSTADRNANSETQGIYSATSPEIKSEVRYARNTSKMTTLMHVDPTLPLWMFFDVYGNVQKIKILGSANPSQTRRLRPASACIANSSGSSGLTVALPPRVSTAPSTPTQYHANNTISNSNPNNNNNILSPSSPTAAMSTLVLRSLSMPPSSTSSSSSTSFHTSQTTANTSPVEGQSLMSTFSALPVSASNQNRGGQANPYLSFPSTFDSGLASINSSASDDSPIVDNESNECNVCYERPINSVLYTCGHMCMCFECALAVKQERGALCPICRQEIKDVIKTFRS
uniref:RING-type domain-containing protein n=1 Tax=Octopus bimaculoides TaxID=37653 RepID=A0A0L8HWM1_OCTBM